MWAKSGSEFGFGRRNGLLLECRAVVGTRDLGLTFAGGGSRSFYQVGLLEQWGPRVIPRLAAVSGVSAGAAMAALTLAGRAEEALAAFTEERRGLRRNVQPSRLLAGERPMPHDGIYRRTMLRALEGEGFARLRALPFPLYVLCAVVPPRVPPAVSVFGGLLLYQAEKKLRPRMLHPTVGRRVGFVERAHDARQCATLEDLVDLILASSSTPPFTRLGAYGGEALLDGSLIDNAPAHLVVEAPGVKKTLVLLTRPYPTGVGGAVGERLYLAPSSKVPIGRWDYREQAPVEATLSLGRRDATVHAEALERFLGED